MMHKIRERLNLAVAIAAVAACAVLWLDRGTAGAYVSGSGATGGVPVKCDLLILNSLGPGQGDLFTCRAADGTLFDNSGKQVPAGKRLLVTDIIVLPQDYAAPPRELPFSLGESVGSGWVSYTTFLIAGPGMFSQHFSAPAGWVDGGHYLRIAVLPKSKYSLGDPAVFGYLVAN